MRSLTLFVLLACIVTQASAQQTTATRESVWSKIKRITKEEVASATGVGSAIPIKTADGRPMRRLKDTALADVFNRESGPDSTYPRVAITITDYSDRIVSRGMNPTSSVAPNDCLMMDITLWHSPTKFEPFKGVAYCAADGMRGFGRGMFNGNFYMATTTAKNTGSRRTAGPLPPANLYPRQVEDTQVLDGPGYALLGNVLMALGFDFTYSGDQGRAWVVSTANKPGT